MKILIVDDSRFMRSWIKKLLIESGFTNTIEAENGSAAIEKYVLHSPEIVLMDVTMPQLNGVEALKEIKKIDSKAKIIMCSSLGQQSLIIETITHGAKDFIVKPYFHNLISTIKRYL